MANHNQALTIQGVTHGSAIVKLTHVECTEAAVTQTFTWAELRAAAGTHVPANALLMSAKYKRNTDFSGGTVASATLSLGDPGAPTELFAAANVFTGAKAATPLELNSMLDQFEALAYEAQLVLTTTVGNVADITAGNIEIAIQYEAH